MEFYTLASSSGGNAALVRSGGTAILLDAGISARRITQSLQTLGLTPRELDAILITHEHSDHVSGIATLTKKFAIPVYASRGTAQFLPQAAPVLRIFDAGDVFSVGELEIRSFRTSHDSADSVDYRIEGSEGAVGALTDTGYVTDAAAQALEGVDTLLLEANHDIDMLNGGPYPYPLKQRILGRRGHLSNEAAAEFALHCVRCGTRDILLAHLSAENNTPEAAEYAVARKLQAEGCPIRLSVAPRDHLSELHEVAPCKKSPSFASES